MVAILEIGKVATSPRSLGYKCIANLPTRSSSSSPMLLVIHLPWWPSHFLQHPVDAHETIWAAVALSRHQLLPRLWVQRLGYSDTFLTWGISLALLGERKYEPSP